MITLEDIQKIEAKWNRLRPIEFIKDVELPYTMKEFFKNSYSITNYVSTVYSGNGKLQTQPNKYRSLVDMYRLCKTYYGTTLIDFLSMFCDYKLTPNTGPLHLTKDDLVGHWCPHIKLLVITTYPQKSGWSLSNVCGHKVRELNGFTFDEILNFIKKYNENRTKNTLCRVRHIKKRMGQQQNITGKQQIIRNICHSSKLHNVQLGGISSSYKGRQHSYNRRGVRSH